jgi:uncharacterized RDD family membrane protein YckC
MGVTARSPAPHATLARRALGLAYEALLLAALLIAGSLPCAMLTDGMSREWARPLFQAYLVALAGAYFVWQWQRGGRTLAMRTWRLRLVTREGSAITWRRGASRFLFALPGALLLGAGFWWALLDREGLFLHDRLAGTKIVRSEE